MSAINKNNLHRPPKSQAVADVQPRAGRFVFHTLSVVVMINGFLALNKMAFSKHIAPQYGGFWQFLTILGLLGSGIAFSVAALSDILPAIPTLRTIKRGIVIFAMPVEIVISSIYWPLVLFMPHLMLPPKQNDMSTGPEPSSSDDASLLFRIPLWMDLSMHAVPAVVLLFDFFFLEKRYKAPASTVYAPLVAITFGSAYSAWVEHCATMNDGKFPYPFLTVMPFSGRVIMYATSTLGALAVFWGLNKAHR